jgi:hypothetical protein
VPLEKLFTRFKERGFFQKSTWRGIKLVGKRQDK